MAPPRTQSNCSFTWTKGSGGEDLVVAEGFMITVPRLGREQKPATPWGTTIQRMTSSQILTSERGVIGLYGKTTDATPPIPTGVQGTLAFTLDSGNSYSIPAKLEYLSIEATNRSPADPQVYIYEWNLSSENGAAGDLVVTG